MSTHIALVHYPVRNRRDRVVTTSVTNLDIHDIARAVRTYATGSFFVTTPVTQQRALIGDLVEHWVHGEGMAHNPVRARAFERVRVARDVEDASAQIETLDGQPPTWVATGASLGLDESNRIGYEALRRRVLQEGESALLLFGTGWGLTDDFVAACDRGLPAIRAAEGDGYNHLSVRSAVSIVLDRLLGAP